MCETKFSGTNADRVIFIFPVQLTTCKTGNLTRSIHSLAICEYVRPHIQSSFFGLATNTLYKRFAFFFPLTEEEGLGAF